MKKLAMMMVLVCLVAGCAKKEKVNGVSLTFDELELAMFDCEDLMENRSLANRIVNHQVTLDPNNSDRVNHAISAYIRLNQLGLIDKDQDVREVGLVCQAVEHQYLNP